MTCDKCGSAIITYYKQRRSDGVWVVTARCENDHHPTRGKPFYPISQFDIASLPVLGEAESLQMELFTPKADDPQMTLLDFFEQKRKSMNRFSFTRKD